MKTRRLLLLLLPLPFAALTALGVPACDTGKTTGAPVTHATRVESADDLGAPIVNAKGWSVTVTHAYLAVESLRTFDGVPVVALGSTTRPTWRWARRALDALSTPNALAHPGHYTPGDALGEMLDPASVDLLLAPVSLGPSVGFTGTYRSAQLTFGAAAAGDYAAALGADVVRLEGTAAMGGTTLEFVATAAPADVTNTDTPPMPAVDGCAFVEAYVVTAPGAVVLRVSPSVWLDQIDFADATPPATPGDTVTLDGTAKKAFVRGVAKGAAYTLVFEPGASP